MIKVIVRVNDPEDYQLAARVAKRVTNPDYEWSDDGYACISFQKPGQESWQGEHFWARRNKSSITIFGPDRNAV